MVVRLDIAAESKKVRGLSPALGRPVGPRGGDRDAPLLFRQPDGPGPVRTGGRPADGCCRHRSRPAARLSPAEGRGRELPGPGALPGRSEEHTSELQSLMRISYAVFCLKKKKKHTYQYKHNNTTHI